MVKALIDQLEKILNNKGLPKKEYFELIFDTLLSIYLKKNYLPYADQAKSKKESGTEDGNLFSAILAYLPDIRDPRFIDDKIYDKMPVFERLEDIDFDKHIERLSLKSHDGAIIFDDNYISDRYIVFKNLSNTAIKVIQDRVGETEAKKIRLLYDILPYFAPKTFSDPSGRGEIQAGAKSETAFELPLAIDGAVSFMLKSTVFKNNLGKVIMCDHFGLSLEGYLDNIPNLDEIYYLDKEKNIVIIKEHYQYDPELRIVVPFKKEIIKPSYLNLPKAA